MRIVALLSLVFSSVFLTQVYAMETSTIHSTIRVSPILLKIQLDPGAKQIYPITIENLTNSPMPIRATVEGFDTSDEQTGYTINPPSEGSPLAHWITISEPDAIIPANTTHEFFIKITIPERVPIGGYHAMIYFTPLYQNSSVGSKIGVVALANIGIQDSLKNKVKISEYFFDKYIYESEPVAMILQVTNDSLHYFSTKPTLILRPIWGKPEEIPLDEKIILPGKSRLWKNVLPIQNTNWGIYKATISTSLENGESVNKTIPLFILPVRRILIFLVLICMILFIIIKRRNVKNAVSILIDPEKSQSTNTNDKPSLQQKPETVQSVPVLKVDDSTRINPNLILETLNQQGGSISKTARILGMHRSTVHRWKQRIRSSDSKANTLQRKSTRPHTLRTSTVSSQLITQIIDLHSKGRLAAKQIKSRLHLSVSERTILRIIKKNT